MDYASLLKKAKDQLPETANTGQRFEIPKVKGHVEGNKTIVNNFTQIAQTLGRNPKHLLKYIQKELATPGEIVKQSVIFKSKIPSSKLNDKVIQYAEVFVICKECGKPDTKLMKEGNIYYIRCQACGARHSVFSKI